MQSAPFSRQRLGNLINYILFNEHRGLCLCRTDGLLDSSDALLHGGKVSVVT